MLWSDLCFKKTIFLVLQMIIEILQLQETTIIVQARADSGLDQGGISGD